MKFDSGCRQDFLYFFCTCFWDIVQGRDIETFFAFLLSFAMLLEVEKPRNGRGTVERPVGVGVRHWEGESAIPWQFLADGSYQSLISLLSELYQDGRISERENLEGRV